MGKIKDHIVRNKEAYLIVSGFVIVSMILLVKSDIKINLSIPIGKENVAISGDTNVMIESPGNSGNLIREITTGQFFRSQGEAARNLGLDKAAIGRNLNGRSLNVKGYIFEKLCDGHKQYAVSE